MNTKPEGAELNLAVIGCGRWGRNHVRVASERYGERLRWICDIDEGRAKALPDAALTSRFTTDILDVLGDATVSAVIIATPAETHYALAQKALEAGKHVLVEKPLSLFSEQARELAHLSRKMKRVLMPGHLLLFHPAIVKIRQMIEEGSLGGPPIRLQQPPQSWLRPKRGKYPLVFCASRRLRPSVSHRRRPNRRASPRQRFSATGHPRCHDNPLDIPGEHPCAHPRLLATPLQGAPSRGHRR